MFSCEFAELLRSPVLKNIYERLLLSDVISTRSSQSNLAFAQSILLKFLLSEQKYKNNLKNCESQEKYIYFTILVTVYNVYVMFFLVLPRF